MYTDSTRRRVNVYPSRTIRDCDETQALRGFFDLYTINHLWFWTIGAQKSGYQFFNILPHKKEERIDSTFTEIVTDVKNRVIEALERSVRSEIGHFGTKGPGSCVSYFKPYSKTYRFVKTYGETRYKNRSLDIIEQAFSISGWDCQYGGKRWAKATHWLIKLKNSNCLSESCFIIDRIFDLQHNTGFILDKTEFRILQTEGDFYKKRRKVTPLTYRAKASITDLMTHCSSCVRNLVIANMNYLPKLPHAQLT